jgi:ATP-dependent DNA helicase RecQ
MPSDCILFYSWADVLAFDRFGDKSSEEVDPAALARQREQVREMFTYASSRDCRHRLLVRHLGETIDACGESCDACAGLDPLGAARPLPRGRRSVVPVAAVDAPPASETAALFGRLKALRKELAAARNVPAYVVFNDATLMRIAEVRPSSHEELRGISGIGPKKLDLYGDDLLATIRSASSPGASNEQV